MVQVAPIGVLSEAVRHGQHVCGIVGSSADRVGMVRCFVRSGLQAGDRVWCFPNGCRPEVLGWLHSADGADEDAIASGQLTVLPTHESVLSVLGADPAGVVDGLRCAVDDALDAGWNGFRMVGDLGWATRGPTCTQQLLDFESRVGAVLDDSPAATLCQYDRYRFDPGTMAALADAHGAVVGTVEPGGDDGLSCSPMTEPGPGLRLTGEVDLSTHQALRAALDRTGDQAGDLHLELSGLSFIDNAGAQILARLARRIGPGRRLVLHRPPQSLTITLTLLRDIPNLVLPAVPGPDWG